MPNEGYIPSDPIRPSALRDSLSVAEKTFKVDLALDSTGRVLAVSPNGDAAKSFGYDNAVQAIRLALEIERGELEQHRRYGLSVPIGSRTSDITTQKVIDAINNTIASDRRFTSVETNIISSGETYRVQVAAKGAGNTGIIPVEFEIGAA
jgi:hypothetical protein